MHHFGGGVGHLRHTDDGQTCTPLEPSTVPPAPDESDARLDARAKKMAKWTTQHGKKLEQDEEIDFRYHENSDWEHDDEQDEAEAQAGDDVVE